jgi:hypothetical protein
MINLAFYHKLIRRIVMVTTFRGTWFTTKIDNEKLSIEIPVKELKTYFENSTNNVLDDDETPFAEVKSGENIKFAEFIGEHLLRESDQEDGTTHIDRAFDSVFELIFEGFENPNCVSYNEYFENDEE